MFGELRSIWMGTAGERSSQEAVFEVVQDLTDCCTIQRNVVIVVEECVEVQPANHIILVDLVNFQPITPRPNKAVVQD